MIDLGILARHLEFLDSDATAAKDRRNPIVKCAEDSGLDLRICEFQVSFS